MTNLWREALAFMLAGALALGATGTLAGVAFAQGAGGTIPPLKIYVSLDGNPLGAIARGRAHDVALISVAPLAHALHWRFVSTSIGAQLDDGSGARGLRVGSRLVREDGMDTPLFNQPLIEREGILMLALDDAATFFALKIVISRGTTIALASEESAAQGPVTVTEVARLIVHVKPTPRPAATQAAPNSIDAAAGQFVISMEQDGKSRVFRTGIQVQGSLLRANLTSTGTGPLNPPFGTVRLGAAERNTSFGASNDPLLGLIMRNGRFNGIDIHSQKGTRYTDVIAGRRPADGRSMLAVIQAHGSGSDAIAILTKNGRYDQTVVRHTEAKHMSWGTIIEEGIASERGIGAAITAKTRGRTFIESRLSLATGSLPLAQNDAPTSLVIGRNFSPAFTTTAGIAMARGNSPSPFLGLSIHSSSVALSIGGTAQAVNVSLAYRGNRGNAQLEVVPGMNRVVAGQGMLSFQKGQLEFEAASESGENSGSLQYQTTKPGINFIAGIRSLSGHGLGPIVGVVLPILRSLGVEVSIKPGAIKGSALHLSLIAGIPARHPRIVTFPMSVHVDDVATNVPLRLLVDGVPIAKFQNAQTIVNVTPGTHDLFVETIDGALGSPSRSIDIHSATSAKVTLWPQRTIRGHVRLNVPATQISQDFPLSAIALVITPGNVSVETDADGDFVFARQPIDPQAVLAVDPDTLPRGFAAPAPLALRDGAPLELLLGSTQPVERQIFR